MLEEAVFFGQDFCFHNESISFWTHKALWVETVNPDKLLNKEKSKEKILNFVVDTWKPNPTMFLSELGLVKAWESFTDSILSTIFLNWLQSKPENIGFSYLLVVPFENCFKMSFSLFSI